MAFKIFMLFAMSVTLARGQRPQFAGSRPIGYPEVYNRTTTEALGDRFGEDDVTTPRLPLEANGDRELVDRLSKLPIDKQPFWFINWQALEANRQKPQTYPQRPSSFVDDFPSNTGSSNTNTGTPISNTVTSTSNTATASSNTATANSNTATSNTRIPNTNLGTPNSNIGSTQVPSQAVPTSQPSDVANSNSNLQNRFGPQDYETSDESSLESSESIYDRGSKKYNNKLFKPRTPIID